MSCMYTAAPQGMRRFAGTGLRQVWGLSQAPGCILQYLHTCVRVPLTPLRRRS
jgi:hypothetical protein